MNKNIVGAIVAVLALGGIAGVVLANQPEKTSTSNNSSNVSQTDMSNMDAQTHNQMQTDSAAQDLTGQTEIAMDIRDFEFTKNNIKVSKGTKVTWTNQDKDRHNAFSADANGPKGKLLSQGESYSFTFNTAGTFDYICEPHPYMKGSVTVVE